MCFFRADLKNKMAALASDWLTHFRLLCNRWTELNETWQEARFYSSFTEFVFFGPIGKTRGLPWPLIGWDIFDFVSETAKQNLTKLDRKHDLNALYQVCGFFFVPIKKKKKQDGRPGLCIGLDIFDIFSEIVEWNFNETWQEVRFYFSLTKFVFFGPIGKTRWPFRHLIGWDIINYFKTA